MARHVLDEQLALTIPDDWEVWEASDNILFVAAAPELGRDDIQPHFFVARDEAEHDSSESFLTGNVIYLQSDQEGYVERSIEMLSVDGHQIGSLTYDAPTQDWMFTNKQFFLVVGEWQYLVTCKMLPEQFEKWSGSFDNIITSLDVTTRS